MTSPKSNPGHDETIEALRQGLGSAAFSESGSFGLLADRFLALGSDPSFVDAASEVSAQKLEQLVITAVARLSPNAGFLFDLRILRHAESDFLHGVFLVPSGPGYFFWFEDDQRGLVSIPLPNRMRATARIGFLAARPPVYLVPKPPLVQ